MLHAYPAITALVASAACTLVVHGASTERATTPESIEFVSEGEKLIGLLYRPGGSPADAKPPVVVIAPPWLNVKEQVATRWAEAMAARGVAALAFDYRYWGESGGSPREYESASAKIVDLHAAVRYLQSRPDVDPARVGAFGICFGAGHVLAAAASHDGIRSIATAASWVHDRPSITALFSEAGVRERMQVGAGAREAFERTGEVRYVSAASTSDRSAAMFSEDPNGFYVTSRRGVVPQWTNRMASMSWPEFFDFDGIALAERVRQPALIVHSDGSALPENVRRVFAHLQGPKDLFWTEGEHTEFYDSPSHVSKVADAVAAHFHRTLGGVSPVAQSEIEAVVAVVNSVASLADQRRWSDLRGVFSSEVDVDYSSLTGSPAARVRAEDLIAGWKEGLSTFASTEHIVGGHQVTISGDIAECRARFIATHIRSTKGPERWTCGGHYRYTLAQVSGQWKVTGTVMTLEWEQGSR
ncbi:MAG: nuclear transport factor 2 family protein [Planctomycetota bacterium]|nr:nuclear transport factor 2 family protein [Planctomycetota bacterium]